MYVNEYERSSKSENVRRRSKKEDVRERVSTFNNVSHTKAQYLIFNIRLKYSVILLNTN